MTCPEKPFLNCVVSRNGHPKRVSCPETVPPGARIGQRSGLLLGWSGLLLAGLVYCWLGLVYVWAGLPQTAREARASALGLGQLPARGPAGHQQRRVRPHLPLPWKRKPLASPPRPFSTNQAAPTCCSVLRLRMSLLYLLLLPLLLILLKTTQAEQGSAAWHGLAMFIAYSSTRIRT